TFDCPPPGGPQSIEQVPNAMAEQQSFASSDLGFHVDYPSTWSVQSSNGSSAVFKTRYGYLKIVGMHGAPSALQLITQTVAGFRSPQLPDLAAAGVLRGAHVGGADGVGQLYSGTLNPQ